LSRRSLLPASALVASILLSAGCAAHSPTVRPHAASPPVPPTAEWTEEGIASWYGGNDGFEGKPTASGEIYDGSQMTAAHRELPLGTVVFVDNLDNGRRIRVRINDRGPFVQGRIIDLSRVAAREAGVVGPGTARVRLTIESLAPARAPVSPTGLWAVQVGSFADSERARRHADRVRAAGQTVYLEPYRGLSRVKVGPYESRRKAEETLARLEEQGFEGIVTPK
jgi:rare lipoprotein A